MCVCSDDQSSYHVWVILLGSSPILYPSSGDNGQTWAALSTVMFFLPFIPCVISRNHSKLSLMVRQGLHQLAPFAHSLTSYVHSSGRVGHAGVPTARRYVTRALLAAWWGCHAPVAFGGFFPPPLLKSCCLLYIR